MADTNTAAPDRGLVKIGANTVPLALAQRALQRFANWFWWVAGLSIINSLAAAMNLGYRMVLGLGVTQYLDALFPSGETAHLVLVLAAAGLFFAFGYFARRGNSALYVIGMVVYAADALLFVPLRDWISVGFHAFVLYQLWRGLVILRAINERPEAGIGGPTAV